jgi:galactoside O-acetyltransferase
MISIIKAVFREVLIWLDSIISYTPGITGILIRRFIFKRKVKKSGNNVNIGIGVDILGSLNIQTGDNIFIMKHSSLYAHSNALIKMGSNININSNTCIGASDGGKIILGDNVLIGQNVVLRASNHEFKSNKIPIIKQGHTGGEIIIGDDCWIAANVVITSGVNLAKGTVVAAGAVVTKSTEPYSIVGGVPARKISERV